MKLFDIALTPLIQIYGWQKELQLATELQQNGCMANSRQSSCFLWDHLFRVQLFRTQIGFFGQQQEVWGTPRQCLFVSCRCISVSFHTYIDVSPRNAAAGLAWRALRMHVFVRPSLILALARLAFLQLSLIMALCLPAFPEPPSQQPAGNFVTIFLWFYASLNKKMVMCDKKHLTEIFVA